MVSFLICPLALSRFINPSSFDVVVKVWSSFYTYASWIGAFLADNIYKPFTDVVWLKPTETKKIRKTRVNFSGISI